MDQGSRLAREILNYLLDHPDVQDTSEGIIEWWLLETHIRRADREVRYALEWLVEQSFVLPCRGADSQTRYRLNRDRLPQIWELLGAGSGGSHDPSRPADRKET